MADYGDAFRTFKHGALHGTIAGIFIALPIIGTNALFERKSAKYIFINTLINTPPIIPAFIPTWFTLFTKIANTKVAKIGP